MSANHKSSRGFTLIEVMVALSVLALAISGLAKLTQTAYQHSDLSRQYQEASYLADSHLNSLIKSKDLSAGYQSGNYQGLQNYTWQLSLTELESDVLSPASKQLSTKVVSLRADLSVAIDNGRRQLKFHTLILAAPAGVGSD